MRTGVGEQARVCEGTAGKKKGGSPVRGAQESDRTASPAPAEIEVCARALPGLLRGGTGLTIAGALLFYLLRPKVRAPTSTHLAQVHLKSGLLGKARWPHRAHMYQVSAPLWLIITLKLPPSMQ